MSSNKISVHMRIDKDIIKKFDKLAKDSGITRTALITLLMTNHMKKEEERTKP